MKVPRFAHWCVIFPMLISKSICTLWHPRQTFTMGLVNIFYPLKCHFHGLKESAVDRSEKGWGILLKWKNSLKERVPASLSWERSQLSFLWMPHCCPWEQYCVVRVVPKSFSLDLATMSVCPTRSCFHFFELCNDCFASLKEGQQRKRIKFIHC